MNLPADFISRTRPLVGEHSFAAFHEALQAEPPVSIRVNRLKSDVRPDGCSPVGWCTSGYYLPMRPTFTFDPLFHAGCYYVQEASSMFLEQVLRQYVHEQVLMLDLCAAPGGKSTLALSALPEGSLLVANEVMRARSQVLAENLVKWGHPCSAVLQEDPAAFSKLPVQFDVVLTDVPCSGEGMFRKDPVAIDEWSVDHVALCWQRQRRILRDIWACLKPGGLLIYSTCTYNREENEDNVAWIARELGAEVLPVDMLPEWHIAGNLTQSDFPVCRFLPHLVQGEGLFMAVLRKTGEPDDALRGMSRKKAKGVKGKGKQPVVPREVKAWLTDADNYEWTVEGNHVVAYPSHRAVFESLRESMHLLHGGIPVAEVKGRDLVPCHALAMSACMDKKAFPVVELDYAQAIAYLRKEAITLPVGVSRGYVLVAYKQVPLGFVKNIGNRSNNLYPQEWRIRSTYLPDAPVAAW